MTILLIAGAILALTYAVIPGLVRYFSGDRQG